MDKPKFYIYKNDEFEQKERVLNNLKNLINEMSRETDVCIELKNIKKEPTSKQRAYYFGVVLTSIKKGLYDLGNDQYKTLEDVHLFMKEMLLHYDITYIHTINESIQTRIYKSVSNKKGDKEETKKYIDECIRWAAENLSIVIPSPEEYGY